jgi:hypothetical protein
MPPLPALHLKALDDLARQLRFAPVEAVRRQLERAEELFAVVTPEQTYPEDWIVFAITGYRPEIRTPTLVIGSALIKDLGILVERLSDAAELSEGDLPGLHDEPAQWIDAAGLCERWKISRKTLDRYRRQSGKDGAAVGLPARRVRAGTGRDKLYFSMRFVREFEAQRAGALAGAGTFTRLDRGTEEKIVRLAGKYRARLGWSLNRTAERLAERFGRGHETVRQLLQRRNVAFAAEGGTPVFTERGPLTDRERRVIVRAHARGVPVEAMADRFERTRPSIYRVLARERADFLRSLKLVSGETPSIPRPEDVMRAPSVRGGLGRGAPATLAEMIAAAEAEPLPDPRAERHRASAYWILRAECARLIGALPKHNAAAGACDEIETRLRWASRLKAELVRSQQALVFKTIRAGLGAEITSLSRSAAAALLAACIEALIEGTGQFDPTRGGRLAAPVGLALNRAVTRWAKGSPEPARNGVGLRAVTFTDPEGIAIDDWTRRVDAWQTALEPEARARKSLSGIEPERAKFLKGRFCWGEGEGTGPPRTVAELAAEFKLTLHHASAMEHDSLAAALRSARAPRGPARG